MSPTEKDVLAVIDSKIAATRHEQERLRRAAELLPTVESNLAALLRTRTLLSGGEEPQATQSPLSPIAQAIASQPSSIGGLAVEILHETGRPLHVDEFLTKLHAKGRRVTRHTLVGTLARYVKEGQLRRTAPSIYALPGEGRT